MMTKFKDTFFYNLVTSIPFKLFIFIIALVLMGMYIETRNNHKKVIQMQEDVLYIHPKIDTTRHE
jgi:hypothetical protein